MDTELTSLIVKRMDDIASDLRDLKKSVEAVTSGHTDRISRLESRVAVVETKIIIYAGFGSLVLGIAAKYVLP